MGLEGQSMAGIKLQWQISRPLHTSSLVTTNQFRDGQTREKKKGTFTKWQLSQQRNPQRIKGTFISVATREFRQADCKYFCRLCPSPRSSLPFSGSAFSVSGPSFELILREEDKTWVPFFLHHEAQPLLLGSHAPSAFPFLIIRPCKIRVLLEYSATRYHLLPPLHQKLTKEGIWFCYWKLCPWNLI